MRLETSDLTYKKPIITVIIAVFNGASYLQRCIDSIANQTYSNKELVIIDGGSTDGTVDILEANTEKITYWESRQDKGIYHAWNKALDHVQGDWIAFLGSDDYLWGERVLEKLSPFLSDALREGIRVVYGQVAFVDLNGKLISYNGEPWDKVGKRFKVEMSIPHPGTLHHKSLFSEHGKFDETYQIVGDYELLMRELKEGRAYFVDDLVTTGFQDGGLTNTAHCLPQAINELSRIRRKYTGTAYFLLHPSRMYLKTLLAYWVYKLFGVNGFSRVQQLYNGLRGLK